MIATFLLSTNDIIYREFDRMKRDLESMGCSVIATPNFIVVSSDTITPQTLHDSIIAHTECGNLLHVESDFDSMAAKTKEQYYPDIDFSTMDLADRQLMDVQALQLRAMLPESPPVTIANLNKLNDMLS